MGGEEGEAEDESECGGGVCVGGAWWEGARRCSLRQAERIRSWLMPRAMRFHSSVVARRVRQQLARPFLRRRGFFGNLTRWVTEAPKVTSILVTHETPVKTTSTTLKAADSCMHFLLKPSAHNMLIQKAPRASSSPHKSLCWIRCFWQSLDVI